MLPRIPKKIWFIWGAIGLLLEGIALANRAPGDTLTAVIVWLLPAWFGAMALGWLAWHFASAWILKILGRWNPR